MELQTIEYWPLNTYILLQGQYPMPVQISKYSFKESHSKDKCLQLKKKIRKFYHRRHFLFKKFDDGIQLDDESWYSVIPEEMAIHISQKIKNRGQDLHQTFKIIDGFCGSGGLAIQMALLFDDVVCIDLDKTKLDNLEKNSKIYGCNIQQIIQSDFLEYSHQYDEKVVLLLCPPWGGVNYFKKTEFDLELDLPIPLSKILKKAYSITCNIVLQLPKNINLEQLIQIIQDAIENIQLSRCGIEIEMLYLNQNLNQLLIYIGNIVGQPIQAELQYLGMIGKSKIKMIKELGIKEYLKQLTDSQYIQKYEKKN